jgi:hypothetical protein
MKKILLTLFAALFALNVAAQGNKNGTCGPNDNAYWQYNNGVLTIGGEGSIGDYELTNFIPGVSNAPWYSFSATSNGSWEVFYPGITKIIIKNGITRIGNNCFRGLNITEVSLPSTLQSIGSNAFYNCTSLETISVPESVTDFGTQVFFGCTNLTSTCEHIIVNAKKEENDTYTILEDVKYIEQGAFDACDNMKYLIYKGYPKVGGNIVTADWRDQIITTAVPSNKFELFNGYHGPNRNMTKVAGVSDSRFKSYAFLHDVLIPENITAYTATTDGTDGTVVTLKSITTGLIKAGVGVFLKAKKGHAGDFTFTNGAGAKEVNDNMLVGVTEETTLTRSDYAYVMQTRDGVQKFYIVDAPLKLARFKAYLKLEGNNANMFSIFDFDENTTDIEETEENEDCSANSRTEVYNMAGQKLSAPQKGLNIINGKIVIN